MATYIPNATQITEPTEDRPVESAALEFRTLKEYAVGIVDSAAAAATVASAESAAEAEAAAEAAAQTANVVAWEGSTYYSVGATVWDTTNFLTYRRKTAGYSPTRPGLDPTNWQLLTGLGNVSLDGVQTLTNKTHGSGSTWDGNTIPIAKGGTGTVTAAAAFSAIKQAATTTATGVVELANNAEAAAGTDTARAVTPAGLRAGMNATGSAPVYACRAWVKFNGIGTVAINSSGNVSSITDNGVGDYTVNFSTGMQDADYNVVTGCSTSSTANNVLNRASDTPATTTAVRLRGCSSAGNPLDISELSVAIFR